MKVVKGLYGHSLKLCAQNNNKMCKQVLEVGEGMREQLQCHCGHVCGSSDGSDSSDDIQ